MWTEKYRPKSFKDIRGQKEIVERVKRLVESKSMPHLLFAGPAGVGKTTLALVIAHELYGSNWRDNFLELNASDERGIDVIRDKVKNFARTKAIGDAPFKIIYLDEADALTRDAQQALRRIMENYTSTCRFILACNYSSKIIEPIQSRCTVFRFKPLPKEELIKLLKTIAEKEGLKIDEKALEALYIVSEGDARKSINILQGCSVEAKEITEEIVYKVAGYANPKEILKVLELALKGEFEKARELLLNTMLQYGLAGIDVIKQLQRFSLKLDIDDHKKLELIHACGETEFRIVEGSDEFIQLEALLAKIGLLSI